MPRNDLKAYETLTARIPQDLVDVVKRYASLHRCTVSEIIRDSLQMYLDTEGPGRATSSGQEVRQGQTEVIQEVLREVIQEVRQGQTEVIQEVRRTHASLAQALEAATVQGQTEVIHDTGTDVLQGHTKEAPPVPVVQDEGHTEVLQSQTARATRKGQTEVLQGHTEVRPQKAVPPFDPARFQLGRLCVGGHAYHGTPQTLYRLPKMVCPQCDAARARDRRAAKRQAAVR